MLISSLYAIVAVIIVSLLAFLGLFSFVIEQKKQKKFLIYFISLAAGALFGDVFIHLLPEIAKTSGFTFSVSLSLLGGVMVFFILEKIIHGQHYHGHDEHGKKSKKEIQPVAYMSLIVSTTHNFLDGVVIASAFLINIPAGVATAIAVGLHEIPHEVGSFSILLHGGFSRTKALFVNFISALFALLGAFLALWLSGFALQIHDIILPIAAGGLLYIAGSDLIPELHKESEGFKAAVLQIVIFLFGIALMAALILLE